MARGVDLTFSFSCAHAHLSPGLKSLQRSKLNSKPDIEAWCGEEDSIQRDDGPGRSLVEADLTQVLFVTLSLGGLQRPYTVQL